MQHHIQLALYAAADRSIGDEIPALLAGDIFFVLHCKEYHFVPELLKAFGKRKVISLRAALHIVKLIYKQNLHKLSLINVYGLFYNVVPGVGRYHVCVRGEI